MEKGDQQLISIFSQNRSTSDIGHLLLQARRDAELSIANNANEISDGTTIASMISNVDKALQLMMNRELELLANQNVLQQIKLIHELMKELKSKLSKSMIHSDSIKEGKSILAEGIKKSLEMIAKYVRFAAMQKEPKISSTIQPDKVCSFIVQMFDPALASNVPNAYQLLRILEQGEYEDEALDGLWIPVKFGAPISPQIIKKVLQYIEEYEPLVVPMGTLEKEIVYEMEEMNVDEFDERLIEFDWHLKRSVLETDFIKVLANGSAQGNKLDEKKMEGNG